MIVGSMVALITRRSENFQVWQLRMLRHAMLSAMVASRCCMCWLVDGLCSAVGSDCPGDLGRVQQQASSSMRGLPAASLLGSTGGLRAGVGQARGHLEANMAAALALQSPQEYKRWLATYASHLAGNLSLSNPYACCSRYIK